MHPRVVMMALCFALIGCAQQRIDQGLAAYAGQPAATLFAKLSYPDGRAIVDGRRAYVWGSEHASGSFLAPTAGATRQMNLASTTLAMTPVDHTCMIRVVVDDNDRVVSWDAKGNEGGCAPYARRLTR